MKKILVLGATSAIAREVDRLYARDGDRLFLVARSEEKLKIIADDLRVRGAAKVEWIAADLNDFDRHPGIFKSAVEALEGLDLVLVAHGSLGDPAEYEKDFAVAEREIKTNFVSVVSFLTLVAGYFENQRKGCLAVIASVAGDRARRENYLYSAAKGGLTLYLEGLRLRFWGSGVSVVTLKPGFVDTPMTAKMKKNFLFASPEAVARSIVRAIRQKKSVVYIPWFWSVISALICLLPRSVIQKIKTR